MADMDDEDFDPAETPCAMPPDVIVYLVEGSQVGYGDTNAWEVCR